MKNRLRLLFSSALACGLLIPQAKAADIAANTARIQAMDKITGRVSEIDVPVNGLANFGTFSILIRKCIAKSPEETPENTAFVDVVDNYQTANPVNIFKGWMFSSTPALNAVEHPIYDIWLLKCYNRPQQSGQQLSTEQLALRDTIPMVRSEAISVSTKIDAPDDETSTAEQPDALAGTAASETAEVIKVDIDENDVATENLTEEEFASEGEENYEITAEELPDSAITQEMPAQPSEALPDPVAMQNE